MIRHNFDLLVERWIPCVKIDDASGAFGIRSALEKSPDIRSIEHESPIVRLSTFRLLLAFCYRVAHATNKPLSSFRNWQRVRDAWENGIPSCEIDQYLDKYHCRDRFHLFVDVNPFFQVADLECLKGGQPEAATRLTFEQFAGTPTSLWEHAPELPSLEETALYLVASQAVGASTSNTSKVKVGNIEYSPTGRTFAPTYTGCIVWLEGANLLETLLLNLVDYDMTDTDFPIWEKPLTIHALRARQPQKAQPGDLGEDGKQIKIGKKMDGYKVSVPTGPVQLFTWPSRAVRIVRPEDRTVEKVFFTQGLPLGDHPVDPMKPYDLQGKPIGLQKEKAAWRDLHALLSLAPNHGRTVLALSHAARCGMASFRLNIAGIARGDEVAKILFWRHERMPVPASILNDVNLIERLGHLLKNAENAAQEQYRRTKRVCRFYRVPDGREPSEGERDDINKLVEAIDPRPAYWARMEKHFFRLLEHLPDDWDTANEGWKADNEQAATNTWRDQVKREGRKALKASLRSLGTTARSLQAVARIRTDFQDADLESKPLTPAKGKKQPKGGKKK